MAPRGSTARARDCIEVWEILLEQAEYSLTVEKKVERNERNRCLASSDSCATLKWPTERTRDFCSSRVKILVAATGWVEAVHG